ncbi:hypothetical protein EGI22_07495 [Lacihabitans sp. LS3-19]|uniref:hypothetical protein n=1 Tax=Lacihabitans sp. LS3-19 TaxID=2487335 RepID=UPI0020CBCF49|nr:hypothetical protein [Lacihabitans sp. LS3-19]MCP9767753.1 hypothetical protein [Lacihabitans sp. LS3-19]
MKILIFSIFLFASFSTFAQDTDENGRIKGTKASTSFIKSEVNFLSLSTLSTQSNAKLIYNLPDGISSGKIILFHPKKDIELKSYNLTSSSGTIDVDLTSLNQKSFTAALYTPSGKLIKSLNLN